MRNIILFSVVPFYSFPIAAFIALSSIGGQGMGQWASLFVVSKSTIVECWLRDFMAPIGNNGIYCVRTGIVRRRRTPRLRYIGTSSFDCAVMSVQ